jgi:hypothetical protein
MFQHIFFSLSTDIKETIKLPEGTIKRVTDSIAAVEKLGVKPTQLKDNSLYWMTRDLVEVFKTNSREDVCRVFGEHNSLIPWLYKLMSQSSKSPSSENVEEMTPQIFHNLVGRLNVIDIPPHCWTPGYFVERMEHFYEVMRGRESEGSVFMAGTLTPEQAGAVIRMLDFLDPEDHRLEVPLGHDHLTDEYHWCSKCGAVHFDDLETRIKNCPNRPCELEDIIEQLDDAYLCESCREVVYIEEKEEHERSCQPLSPGQK